MQQQEQDEFVFARPRLGTPAAAALQANENLKVSKFDKGYRRLKGIKHPKIKGRKRSVEGRKFSRNFKGNTIEGIHEQYTLTIGMMLGIRVAIGGVCSHPDISKNLAVEDFGYVEKIEFPPDGNNKPPHCTPPHALAHTFKFKTYAPKVFSKIRQFFSVDSAAYMESMCGDSNYLEFISNSKSGQFFFYSHDGRYMIKTQTKEENKFMKRILPHYYKYIFEHPSTLLVKIFGMHRVKMYHLNRKIHFVIMASVFDTTEVIHQIYDLKGSLIGRSATEAERANGGVLKDNDLVDDEVKFHLGNKKPSFIQQLKRDTEFLATLNIMDYSLLVGVHDRSLRSGEDGGRSRTPFRQPSEGGAPEEHGNRQPCRIMSASDVSECSVASDMMVGRDEGDDASPALSISSEDLAAGTAVEPDQSDPVVVDPSPPSSLWSHLKDTITHSVACLQAGPQLLCLPHGASEPQAATLFRHPADLKALIHSYEEQEHATTDAVYGPGTAGKRPWTGRADGGINSRDSSSGRRGEYIYYIGMIDILQQYDSYKRIESLYKGLFHDRSLISAVPARAYADRFVRFFEEHID